MKNIFFYETKLGKIGIAEENGSITDLFIGKDSHAPSEFLENETGVIKKAHEELVEYLDGKRKVFTVPLSPSGTDFQKRVWDALLAIPYGETRSYKEIARYISNPKACRAVGGANGKNPIAIFIPCHRVISSDGALGGFSSGIEYKKRLLEIERSRI